MVLVCLFFLSTVSPGTLFRMEPVSRCLFSLLSIDDTSNLVHLCVTLINRKCFETLDIITLDSHDVISQY